MKKKLLRKRGFRNPFPESRESKGGMWRDGGWELPRQLQQSHMNRRVTSVLNKCILPFISSLSFLLGGNKMPAMLSSSFQVRM